MQNIFWKTVLIIILVGGCLWATMPPDERIRLGRDLSGGVSLVYSVRTPEGVDRRALIDQTIRVLSERVNPQGVLDIAMTPLGGDRIEVVMPLPNEEVKALAAAFELELASLVQAAEIKSSELDSALEAGTAVDRFGDEGDRGQQVAELQEAYDSVKRLEAEGFLEDAGFLIGIGPIASAKSALWMNDNLFGVDIPENIINRIQSASDEKEEGKKICAEILEQLQLIKGVSGAHLMGPNSEAAAAEVIEISGILESRTEI